jgi:hypothetical protein
MFILLKGNTPMNHQGMKLQIQRKKGVRTMEKEIKNGQTKESKRDSKKDEPKPFQKIKEGKKSIVLRVTEIICQSRTWKPRSFMKSWIRNTDREPIPRTPFPFPEGTL